MSSLRHPLPLHFLALSLLSLSVAVSVSGHGGGDSDGDDAGGGASEHRDLRSRSLVLTKIYCLVVVFFGTFAGGVSPYFLKWNERFLALGTQFAGGVFLGTALMHFLSDSNETFGDLTDKEYPFAFMLACAGYLLTMLADCTVSSAHVDPINRPADPELQGAVQMGKFSESGQPVASHCQVQVRATHPTTTTLGDSILLIMALCFHSVFEGIAIGVAETEADAWRALWTVCLHKIFAAIAMGIALLQIIPDRPLLSCAAYAFAFAISSPIGVGIGIIIDATTQGKVADWIFAISMGLACGVFIYVCINHLLSKVDLPQKTATAGAPLYRFLAVLLGVGVIAVVMIWDT